MNMRNPLVGFTISVLVMFLMIICAYIYLSQPDYIEGEIVEKYIDSDNQDYFKFVILDNDGKYQICRVSADQYYSHEVGDWFDGEVYYADDPDSGWD